MWKCQQDTQSWVFVPEFPRQASVQESEGQGLYALQLQYKVETISSESNPVQSQEGEEVPAPTFSRERAPFLNLFESPLPGPGYLHW